VSVGRVQVDDGAVADRLDNRLDLDARAPGPRRGPTAAQLHRLPRLLPLFDVLVVLGTLPLAHWIAVAWLPETAGRSILGALVAPIVWLATFSLFGVYSDLDVGGSHELRRVIGATGTGTLALAMAGGWWGQPITRLSLGSFFAIAALLELGGRSVARLIFVRARRDGFAPVRTAVVGTDEDARDLARRIFSAPEFDPVGLIDVSGADGHGHDGFPVVGSILETEAILRRDGVQCVYVPSSAVSARQMEALSQACRRAGAELRISTNVSGIHPSRLLLRSAEGVTALSVKPVRLSGWQAGVKRTFDVVFGSLALLLALPIIGVVAAAIRLTSPGPAFFPQARVTKDGRTFTMYKFRSMVIDSERALDGTVIDLTTPFFKMEDDPRLTRIGRALRSLSLDELPQLWNIVRGDMSLIGPRPLPLEQVEANPEFLAPRHEVRGGLTGLWQVSGRSELDSEEALRIDRYYIENWSLGLDIWILLKTVGAVIARRGAL
jgi:exopolysaccharide biosynthesis polyprenyl glycosylphosphotransferase